MDTPGELREEAQRVRDEAEREASALEDRAQRRQAEMEAAAHALEREASAASAEGDTDRAQQLAREAQNTRREAYSGLGRGLL